MLKSTHKHTRITPATHHSLKNNKKHKQPQPIATSAYTYRSSRSHLLFTSQQRHMSHNLKGKQRNDNNNKDQDYVLAKAIQDPTMHSTLYISSLSASYSQNRPNWATDLEFSLSETPNDITSPVIKYPTLHITEDNYDVKKSPHHPTLKIPMIFSKELDTPEIDIDYTAVNIQTKPTRAPKNNTVMLVSYRGTGYNGSQLQFANGAVNSNVKTIEQEVLNALRDVGYITERNSQTPQKVKFSRAARTDKGVHAGCNSLNCRLQVPYIDMSPEIMYVYKKAMKYSALRYQCLFPTVLKYLSTKIQQSAITKIDPLNTMSCGDDNTKSTVALLTNEIATLPTFFKQHIAFNISGNITISPDMLYTLKQFKLFNEDDSIETIQADIMTYIHTALDKQSIPFHQFTEWELRLLQLAVEFNNEWDNFKTSTAGADLEEDAEGYAEVKRDRNDKNASQTQQTPYAERVGFTPDDLSALIQPDFFSDTFKAKLRHFLPKQIHILRAFRVTNSFDAKENASSRTYEYIIPSFAFMHHSKYPIDLHDSMLSLVTQNKAIFDQQMAKSAELIKQNNTESANATDNNDKKRKRDKRQTVDDENEEETDDDKKDGEGQKQQGFESFLTEGIEMTPPQDVLNYRLTPQDLAHISYALSHYCGARNYWNFTSKHTFKDHSSMRNIKSFSPVGTFTINNVEFIHMVVHGDSFMLNQIRKMVGFVIGVVRGNFDDYSIQNNTEDVPVINRRLDLIYPSNTTLSRPRQNAPREEHDNYKFLLAKNYNKEKMAETEALVSDKIKKVCSDVFSVAFSKHKQALPIAPALGLLLDRVHHDNYDEKMYNTNQDHLSRNKYQMVRDSIYSHFHQKAADFFKQVKQKEIYKEICVQELTTSSAWRWLHLLNMSGIQMNANEIEQLSKKHSQHILKPALINTEMVSNQGTSDVVSGASNAMLVKNKNNEDIILETSEEFKKINKKFRAVQLVDVHGDATNNFIDHGMEYVQLVENTKATIPMFNKKDPIVEASSSQNPPQNC